jgi:hypothetical protein
MSDLNPRVRWLAAAGGKAIIPPPAVETIYNLTIIVLFLCIHHGNSG